MTWQLRTVARAVAVMLYLLILPNMTGCKAEADAWLSKRDLNQVATEWLFLWTHRMNKSQRFVSPLLSGWRGAENAPVFFSTVSGGIRGFSWAHYDRASLGEWWWNEDRDSRPRCVIEHTAQWLMLHAPWISSPQVLTISSGVATNRTHFPTHQNVNVFYCAVSLKYDRRKIKKSWSKCQATLTHISSMLERTFCIGYLLIYYSNHFFLNCEWIPAEIPREHWQNAQDLKPLAHSSSSCFECGASFGSQSSWYFSIRGH